MVYEIISGIVKSGMPNARTEQSAPEQEPMKMESRSGFHYKWGFRIVKHHPAPYNISGRNWSLDIESSSLGLFGYR